MNITILGGGSAGWMTAAYLSHKLDDSYKITLIESKDISNVGVGESTTPYLQRFFKSIGIENDNEWMSECNATIKNGVLYDDWDFVNSRFWHSFEVDEHKYPYWNILRTKNGLDRQDYWQSTMYNSFPAMRDNSDTMFDQNGNSVIPYYNSKAFNGWPQNYAYHIDSDMFGEYLKKLCINNINHIQDTITEVKSNGDQITEIIGSEAYTADLFIDCTGFRRLLIDEVSDSFTDFDPYLTHDKAVVIRYPYLDKHSELKPRTQSKALSSGWRWEIPLYDKCSTGYVYTSSFISDEEAELELRKDIGIERVKDIEASLINIKTGYYKETWKGNVVAVGLSAGFIEPLESTLLFVTQLAGIRVEHVLSDKISIDEFNNEYNDNMDDYLDYISLGYGLSHRDDTPFWRSKTIENSCTPRMKEWLKQYKEKMQPPEKHILFVDSSWISKMIGFNYFPTESIKYRDADMEMFMIQRQSIKNFDYSKLMNQTEYLDKFIYNKE